MSGTPPLLTIGYWDWYYFSVCGTLHFTLCMTTWTIWQLTMWIFIYLLVLKHFFSLYVYMNGIFFNSICSTLHCGVHLLLFSIFGEHSATLFSLAFLLILMSASVNYMDLHLHYLTYFFNCICLIIIWQWYFSTPDLLIFKTHKLISKNMLYSNSWKIKPLITIKFDLLQSVPITR